MFSADSRKVVSVSCFGLMSAWVGLVLIVALVFGVSVAYAQDYQSIVASAISEFEAGNFLEARALFARAHSLAPSARTLRSLGIVSFELHEYRDSIQYLEEALISREKPLDERMQEEARRVLERAHGFVGRVRFSVDPEDAKILVDDSLRVLLPSKGILLDIGKHLIDVSSDGFVSERQAYSIQGGENDVLRVVLKRQPSPLDGNRASRPDRAVTSDVVQQPGRVRYWRPALAISALILGLTSVSAEWMLERRYTSAGRTLRMNSRTAPGYSQRLEDWSSRRLPVYVVASWGTALLASAGAGFVAAWPKRTPWWVSPLLGLAGAGLGTWGTAEILKGRRCGENVYDRRLCSKAQEGRDRGALLVISGIPLLVTSIAQVVVRRQRRSGHRDWLSTWVSPVVW